MKRLASLCLVVLTGSVFLTGAPAEDFVLSFGPEEVIQADGNDIIVPGYSVPSFVDWNNDGLQDLVTGEGGAIGTVTPAKVRVYLSRGTEAQPVFKNFFHVQAAGQDLTLTPEGRMGCFPRVVDWDEDGRKDLPVGYGDGKIRLYRGISKVGDFDGNGSLDGDDFTILAEALDKPIPAGGTPTDLNQDGFVDLLDLRLFADLWLSEHGTSKK